MRTLALLLLVVLALLLVLKFFPSDESLGAEGDEGGGVAFVERPDIGSTTSEDAAGFSAPSDAVGLDEPAEQDPLVAAGAGAEREREVESPPAVVPSDQDGGGGETIDWDPRLEIALAGAVLHGTRDELEGAISALGRSLPAGRAALARAYHRAMAGDLERARGLAEDVSARATTDEERRLLSLALGGRGSAPRPASYSTRREGPLARAMALGLRERQAAMSLEDRAYADAAVGYSDVLKATLDSPWKSAREDLRRWSDALHEAQRHHRWDPKGDWPFEELIVESGESLVLIRRRYLEDKPDAVMCTGLIAKANRLRGPTIHPGDPLRIPTARVSALVDLSERWVLYLHDDEVVYAWECAIGREGEETITGIFTAGEKIPEPPWAKVGQRIVPYGDEENPLGTRWITWMQDGRKTNYGFHGTWEPETLGTAASDGCVRLQNENIELMFDLMPKGASFEVRD